MSTFLCKCITWSFSTFYSDYMFSSHYQQCILITNDCCFIFYYTIFSRRTAKIFGFGPNLRYFKLIAKTFAKKLHSHPKILVPSSLHADIFHPDISLFMKLKYEKTGSKCRPISYELAEQRERILPSRFYLRSATKFPPF